MKGRSTDTLRRQHDELVRLAGLLVELVDRTPLPAAEVQSTLSRLSGVLKVHLAMEDEALYPRLTAHDDPTVRAMAQRFRDEFGDAYRAFLDYRARWASADQMLASTSELVRETKAAVAVLAARVTSENAELYAKVDALFPLPE